MTAKPRPFSTPSTRACQSASRGYEVRLFDSLTPGVIRYFVAHEPDFFKALNPDVLTKLSPDALKLIPADVLAGTACGDFDGAQRDCQRRAAIRRRSACCPLRQQRPARRPQRATAQRRLENHRRLPQRRTRLWQTTCSVSSRTLPSSSTASLTARRAHPLPRISLAT